MQLEAGVILVELLKHKMQQHRHDDIHIIDIYYCHSFIHSFIQPHFTVTNQPHFKTFFPFSFLEMRETGQHVSFRMFCFSMFPAFHLRCCANESLHAHLALKYPIKQHS